MQQHDEMSRDHFDIQPRVRPITCSDYKGPIMCFRLNVSSFASIGLKMCPQGLLLSMQMRRGPKPFIYLHIVTEAIGDNIRSKLSRKQFLDYLYTCV